MGSRMIRKPRRRSGYARRAQTRERWRGVIAVMVLWLGVAPAAAQGGVSCPAVVTFASERAASTLDVGWTGLGHALPLGRWQFGLRLGSCSEAASGGARARWESLHRG
jgi:hypothetical protein